MSGLIKGGRNTYGHRVGILVLETSFPRIPGDIGNATTFKFPVVYLMVKGASSKRVILETDPGLVQPFIEGAQELERRGVRLIATTCGFLALFQKELSASVNVPVVASSLLLVPLVHRMLRPDQRVGIMCCNAETLGERHFNGAGWSSRDIPIGMVGMEGSKHFTEVFVGNGQFIDVKLTGQEMTDAARRLVGRFPDVGAIVMEDANMAPFAWQVQKEVGLPVFDIQTLINMVAAATCRAPYTGTM